jgi:hypothetical protein
VQKGDAAPLEAELLQVELNRSLAVWSRDIVGTRSGKLS